MAFAANSVLCRLALGDHTIDAATFTLVRLASGIVVLLLILLIKTKVNGQNLQAQKALPKGSWSASMLLFVYALCFSFAYTSLATGTGALILFAAVQITMILRTVFSGHKLHLVEWLGLLLAFCGFVYLMLPKITTPSLFGFILMTIAGIAWGFYTINGRNSVNALADTTYNFLRTLPLLLLVLLFNYTHAHYTPMGVLLAFLSGAIASGIGYTLWYIALSGLTTIQAAVVQLLVPVIAALGGLVLISEVIKQRFVLSSVMILGGILLVMLVGYDKKRRQKQVIDKRKDSLPL
ncbi:MAG: EamA family transporter [Gammaproteobacteria bacterium]|nr:MAG: EamA family transporter [Gammaproteobacteria bacterium]